MSPVFLSLVPFMLMAEQLLKQQQPLYQSIGTEQQMHWMTVSEATNQRYGKMTTSLTVVTTLFLATVYPTKVSIYLSVKFAYL